MNSDEFLKMISRGFEKTPFQIILSIIIIASVLGLYFSISKIYFLLINLRVSRKRNEEFEKLIRTYDLTINELDFIDSLSSYLFDQSNKIVLLKNRNTFLKAAGLWIRDKKTVPAHRDSIIDKAFDGHGAALTIDIMAAYGKERPARFITHEGEVYGGRIQSRNSDHILLTDIVKRKWKSEDERGMLFTQDFKGMQCEKAASYSVNPDTIRITLEKREDSLVPSIESVYLFRSGAEKPVKTRMKLLDRDSALVENRDRTLQIGDTIKLSLRKNIRDIFQVNATVLGLSINRATAKIRLGHIDESIRLAPEK